MGAAPAMGIMEAEVEVGTGAGSPGRISLSRASWDRGDPGGEDLSNG